jgi:ABC-type nickel/cobalt efflux system permease component RcnA
MELAEISFLALAGTSLVFGVVHGFDADHVVAVTNFVSKNPEPKKSAIFGFKFGLGHSITVLIFAIIALAFKVTISPFFEEMMEMMAGVLIILLGMWVVRGAWKSYRHRRSHNHEHVHEQSGAIHTHSHDHGDGHVHRHGATFVGVITGLAGTAGVMLFGPVILAETMLQAAIFILLYGLGIILSMSLYGLVVGRFYQLTHKSERLSQMIVGATGLATVVFGVIWVSGILLG